MSFYTKYIKTENIPAFRRYMSTRGQVPFHSFYDCMFSAGGSKRSILTKSSKFEKMNKKTQSYGLYLAPATMVKGLNTCRGEGECASGCIAFTGNLSTVNSQNKQYLFTVALYHHTELMLNEIVRSILEHAGRHVYLGEDIAIRLNSTSDLPFYQVIDMQALCNDIENLSHFYDYTKSTERMSEFLRGGMPKNYHLTLSRSEESNELELVSVLRSGGNVAIVFRGQLPETWNGFEVINGDESDLRFMDKQGVVVGLVEKGLAKKDQTGFVLEPATC